MLVRDDATGRPRPGVWSALEYGCHVRDVHVLFAERVRLMLAVHSMVGAAPALGCEPLGAVARALESALRIVFARGEALSEADAAPIGEVIALLGRALD